MPSSRPRVLLVFSTPIRPDSFFGYLLPPLGLERIAGAIEGIAEVKILDLRFDSKSWLDSARDFRPDFIGVNVKTTLYSSRSYHVADRLKALLPTARIVLGGLHASCIPEEALKHGHITVIGDGEEAFTEIINGKPPEKIPGIAFLGKNGELDFTEPRGLSASLDYLAPPARHLRATHYKYSAYGLIPMDLLETSRGCTQFCPFCSPAALHHGKWRSHSVQYVLDEVKRIWDLGARYVMLTDDQFTGDFDRAKEIADGITMLGVKIGFFTFLRPFLGRMDLKEAMVKAGFVMLSYGAESPNPDQLKRYGKGFSDAENFIKRVNDEWREAGARYIGNSFVFGDPRESVEDIRRMGDYARELDPTYIEPLYSQPYPGTRYRQDLENKDLLVPHNWDRFTEGRMLSRHPDVSEIALRNARIEMWLRFFSPRKIVAAFRIPLYLNKEVGIPLLTVLKYMKACDYSVFGCILEDKYYLPRRRFMVRNYLTEKVNLFSRFERDMTPFTDEFTDMIGLKAIKRIIGNACYGFEIIEKNKILTVFTVKIEETKIVEVIAGETTLKPSRTIRIRLDDAVSVLCGKGLEKFSAVFRTAFLNLFFR